MTTNSADPDADAGHMRHALSLGRRGLGRVWPNPAVGCVLVKNGIVVGRGRTGDGGTPHAETVAIAAAGSNAAGATAYVSLEPCAHLGRTPPCADALVAAGVARVVVAMSDPNPLVAGQGIERLRAAGIAVSVGILQETAQWDHRGFLSVQNRKRPSITLKMASSFDGRIATATGESQWITGDDARRFVHAMRASHDAVMVGGGTARADDPSLNVRDLGISKQPVRVIWSRFLDIPLAGKLAQTAKETPLWIIHDQGAPTEIITAWRGLGAVLIPCEGGANGIEPAAAMRKLAELGLTRILCEGGGELAASLLRAGLVDELVGFTAGIGIGADGRAMLGAMGLGRLAAAPRFQLHEVRAIGADTMTRWRAASGT